MHIKFWKYIYFLPYIKETWRLSEILSSWSEGGALTKELASRLRLPGSRQGSLQGIIFSRYVWGSSLCLASKAAAGSEAFRRHWRHSQHSGGNQQPPRPCQRIRNLIFVFVNYLLFYLHCVVHRLNYWRSASLRNKTKTDIL